MSTPIPAVLTLLVAKRGAFGSVLWAHKLFHPASVTRGGFPPAPQPVRPARLVLLPSFAVAHELCSVPRRFHESPSSGPSETSFREWGVRGNFFTSDPEGLTKRGQHKKNA
jgi:hypothetical protein